MGTEEQLVADEEGILPYGIHGDISEEAYRAGPGISQSDLKLLGEEGGPAKFRYGERKESRQQKLGTLAHGVLLQPNRIMETYHVTKLLRDGTKDWNEEAAAYPGRKMVKQAEFDKVMAMVDAIFRWSPVARELLLSSDRMATEQAFYWPDPESGLLFRGRADAIHEDFHTIIDIKTARSASTEGFRRAVRDFSYHIQSAHYLDGWPLAGGWKPVDFVFIVVEVDYPHLTASYVLDAEDIEAGRAEIRRLVGIYQECERLGDWPGYPAGIRTLPPMYKRGWG